MGKRMMVWGWLEHLVLLLPRMETDNNVATVNNDKTCCPPAFRLGIPFDAVLCIYHKLKLQ